MSKVLKKLYPGDVVASGATKQLRKLTTNVAFTIGTTSYTVAPNTTWGEWASGTNLEITDDGHMRLSGAYACVALLDGTLVNSTDAILENGEYGWLDSEWVGVWYVNDEAPGTGSQTFEIEGSFNVIDKENTKFVTASLVQFKTNMGGLSLVQDQWTYNAYYVTANGSDEPHIFTQYSDNAESSGTSGFLVVPQSNVNAPTLRTFTITGGADINNEDFIAALKANATRQT